MLENQHKDDEMDAAYSKKNQANTRENKRGKILRVVT
jgi:hypothetical protein